MNQQVTLRLVPSLREVSTPVGVALAGDSFLAWCATPRLSGTVHFGRRGRHDAAVLAELYRLLEHPALRPPIVRVVDGRGFEGMDDDAWEYLVRAVAPKRDELRERFGRQAIVMTPGVAGARAAALLPALGPGDAFAVFTDAEAAYVWADPIVGRSAYAEVERLLETVREDALVARVRAWIGAHLRHADLAVCASAFAMSTRTLQRRLGVAGHSFREVVAAERVAAARAMLVRNRTSIDAIAHAVGCSSSSQLGVLLRRAGLPSASVLRAERAQDSPPPFERGSRTVTLPD